MASGAIRVEGLRELERAFAVADKELKADLRDALQEAAAPVRSTAQSLAGASIRNLGAGDPWARMRIGSASSIVYVAPVERGTRIRSRRRRRFADLLLQRAMEPALAMNRDRVVRRIDQMLIEISRLWGRV